MIIGMISMNQSGDNVSSNIEDDRIMMRYTDEAARRDANSSNLARQTALSHCGSSSASCLRARAVESSQGRDNMSELRIRRG